MHTVVLLGQGDSGQALLHLYYIPAQATLLQRACDPEESQGVPWEVYNYLLPAHCAGHTEPTVLLALSSVPDLAHGLEGPWGQIWTR